MLSQKSISSVSRRAFTPHNAPIRSHARTARGARNVCHAAAASPAVNASRRAFLMGSVGAVVLSTAAASNAEDEEWQLLRGMASPPTSYGGYGGNANEAAKYTFEYPAKWKEEKTSKVEKGTQGIDSRVSNPRTKGQGAYVITLGRAGEDNKDFKLTNLESTFSSFAGADYILQDAVQNATNTTLAQTKVDGIDFYQYDIDSPEFRYLSNISVKNGKVFALFVRSPTKSFTASESKLRHIIESFRLL